ncbi:MAG: PHP domain-containing protein [Ignavibacteria bacterium]
MYEYSGVIHIHSTYSDGTGKIEDIAKAASETNADFILMTDHNTLKPQEDGYEKWIQDVMVIIGYEVNDMNNKNHYLTFGIDKVIGSYQVLENGELGCKLSAMEYVKQIKNEGGIGFIAHPDEKRHFKNGQLSYPWTEWDTNDFTGIEIWNHMSEWIEGMNENNKLRRFLHPLKTISSPPKTTLERWDRLSQSRKVTGIGGVDAHAFKQNLLGVFEVEIFAYKILFKSIRTHVLLEEPISVNNSKNFRKYKQNILSALKEGKCFVANSYHGDARGFRFFAEHKGTSYTMGDEVIKKKNDRIILYSYIPNECDIRLIHNGKTIYEKKGFDFIWDTEEAGAFRVECWKNGKGWIFSNHIRIIDRET